MIPFTLRPEQKIKTPRLYHDVTRKGAFYKGRILHLWIYVNAEQKEDGPKFGIIVSKRVDKRATKRNLWKRWLREMFRHSQHEVKQGVKMVWQVRYGQEAVEFEDVRKEFLYLLKKANALKETIRESSEIC